MKLGFTLLATLSVLLGFLWLTGQGQNAPTFSQASHGRPAQELLADNQGDADSTSAIKLAPDFSLKDLNGQTISLAQFRDQKPVILDFWASWCPNCQRDMPKLNNWYQKYRDQVEVLGINLQEDQGTVSQFVTRRGINFPVLLDPLSQASRLFGVRYTNYHVLIAKDGSVAGTVPGDLSEAQIKSLLPDSQQT